MPASLNLDAPSLVSRIADSLRDQILTGQLEPGSKIRQDQYAEAFGVSRTPLREAFRLLEAEGWVQIRPRSGVEVSSFSPVKVQEILVMRLLLEPLAIRGAALNHTPAQGEVVSRLFEQLASHSKTEQGEAENYDFANQEFHHALYGLDTELPLEPIKETLRGYWERYSRYRRVYYWRANDSISHSNDEHRRILDAWVARDADGAERELARHILRAGWSLLGSLDGGGPAANISPHLLEVAKRYDFDIA